MHCQMKSLISSNVAILTIHSKEGQEIRIHLRRKKKSIKNGNSLQKIALSFDEFGPEKYYLLFRIGADSVSYAAKILRSEEFHPTFCF